MKNTITAFILLISLNVCGQVQKEDTPKLAVTGSASITVKPDLAVLNISVSEIRLKMGDALEAIGGKSKYYNELLMSLGFSDKEIKTTSFGVSKNRIYRDNEYLDSGYEASQKIRIEFAYNQEVLQKIVSKFSRSEKPIDFDFYFELSEELKQKVQSQILQAAVIDASDKATIIAKAAKAKLISIKSISYGSIFEKKLGMEQLDKNSRYGSAVAAEQIGSAAFNFTPDDLFFRDTVTIEWRIE